MPPQVRPENALQRAADLIAVGKEQDALETLHDCVKRRPRVIWAPVHHDIMMKHVELAVRLRQPQTAKDALWQYRNIVQQINVKSLDDVVMHFLRLAEARVESARSQSKDIVDEIDDLEQAESPESMMLSAVTSAGAQDRTDRLVLAPWLRFLWDSYRNCLDLLRNNAQVEKLYHEIARRAYKFCVTYNRRTEFRKLCDSLRTHLNQIQKNQQYAHGVKLSSNETLGMMQETRLAQLETALKMEMWTEAYKSSEDVYNIFKLSMSKDVRMLQAKTLTAFYEKLAKVFLMSDNHLYHAAAQCKTFEMYKEQNKKFSAEDQQIRATRCVLAVLSVGTWSETASDLARYLDMEETWSANQRQLAHLLNLTVTPTKQSLMRELLRLGCVDVANEQAKQLYRYLEVDFSPLRLCANVDAALNALKSADQTVYTTAIRRTAATRALKQVSQVYHSISLPRLHAILPYYTTTELEYFLVSSIKKTYIKAHMDHRENALIFAGKPSSTGGDVELTADGCAADDDLNDELASFYACIESAAHKLGAAEERAAATTMLQKQVTVYTMHKDADYARMSNRRRIIEDYKEERDKKSEDQRKKDDMAHRKREAERAVNEANELRVQQIEMERQRRLQMKAETEQLLLDQKIMELRQSAIGQKVLEQLGDEEIRRTNVADLIVAEQTKLAEHRQATIDKQRTSERKWDYYVRAAHGEEVAPRKRWQAAWLSEERVAWADHEQTRVDADSAAYDGRASDYALAMRVTADAQTFMATREADRPDKLDALRASWTARRAKELHKRLEAEADRRYAQKEYEWRKEQQRLKRVAEEKIAEDIMMEEKRENEERRAKRLAEMGGGRKDDDMPSRADQSGNWRGDRVVQQQSTRGGPPLGGQADNATNWRSAPPPSTGDDRRNALSAATTFTSGGGQIPTRAPGSYQTPGARGEQPSDNGMAAASAPTKGAYVPPSMRARQMGGDTGAQQDYPPTEQRGGPARPGGLMDRSQMGARAGPQPPRPGAEAPSGNWR